MNSDEIITLRFPNYLYGSEPVIQRWRKSTLRLMPYFDTLFSQHDNGQKRELEMEDDPEAFAKLVKLVLTRSKSGYMEYLANFYGVKLEENGGPCLLSKSHPQIIPRESLPQIIPQEKTIRQSITIVAHSIEGSCLVPPCQKVSKIRTSYDRSEYTHDIGTSVALLNGEMFHFYPLHGNLTMLIPTINKKLGQGDLEITIRIPHVLPVDINFLLTFVVIE